ncbi:glycosyltransferase family 2 protein [Geodermatophilus sp. SYSU D00697]
MRRPEKIVLLGMITKMPVAGVVWQTLHYLLGFERLGYEAHYVEAHARTPSMLMRHEEDDSSARAADFLGSLMRRFGLGDRWAFHALHADGRCYGMSEPELRRLYRSAALLVNLHGGTQPLAEHAESGRLVYLETDPVQLQVELDDGVPETVDFLSAHQAFFTFGENLGNADCGLPLSDRFPFLPTRQPVVLDLWAGRAATTRSSFTTIGNWRQDWRPVYFRGDTYTWSKHHEFLKVLDLPRATGQDFELALSSWTDADRAQLEEHGWRVRSGLGVSTDLDAYRDYVTTSRAEFTVAKDQNVRLRSGWFSDRSATYLAAGRPVVTQETGFSNALPTGKGLLPFTTPDDAVAAVTDVVGNYGEHSRAAAEVARECFDSDVVLGRLLADLGGHRPRHLQRPDLPAGQPLPADLVLTPISKRPTTLPEDTVQRVLALPLPPVDRLAPPATSPAESVVVVSYDNLVFTRMCLETVLASTDVSTEVIVVDNGSTDGTPSYLREMATRFPRLRPVLNETNLGFVRAANQGLAAAQGQLLVLLNNDTVVPPGWLGGLTAHLADGSMGMVGPVTNAAGNEAQIPVPYRTYGELRSFAAGMSHRPPQAVDIPVLTMFCVAMRRELYAAVGGLDQQFGLGMFEDDDYAERVRAAGLRVVCAQDVFVHHFGEASFGKLVPTGEYGELFRTNQQRFAEKWGRPWTPHGRRPDPEYAAMVEQVRAAVRAQVPPDATVLVVSKGDDELLELGGRRAMHFPQDDRGVYAGHHPADDREAVDDLQALCVRGADYIVFPETSMWWLDHYTGLKAYLESTFQEVADVDACRIFGPLIPP